MRAIRRSHELQFGGMDYQAAMWEVGQELEPPPTHDEIIEIESAPDPGCNCGFCATADWAEVERMWP